MTEEEARQVIDLWMRHQDVTTNAPSLADVAEGLGIPVTQVNTLLAEVRARRQAEERRLAREQRRLEDEQRRLAEERRRLERARRQTATVRSQRQKMYRSRAGRRATNLFGVSVEAVALILLTLVTCAWTLVTFGLLSALWENLDAAAVFEFLVFFAVDSGVIALSIHLWKRFYRERRARRAAKKG